MNKFILPGTATIIAVGSAVVIGTALTRPNPIQPNVNTITATATPSVCPVASPSPAPSLSSTPMPSSSPLPSAAAGNVTATIPPHSPTPLAKKK